jgi:hypothetical protein
VVSVSDRLLEGQARGVLQQVAYAQKWLTQLADVLARGKQIQDRVPIQHDIELRQRGRQFLSHVLHVELREGLFPPTVIPQIEEMERA